MIRNVSSPFRTSGSDIDLEVRTASWLWQMLVRALSWLGVGRFKRSTAYVVSSGNVEVFVLDMANLDDVTLALEINLAKMRSWSSETASSYLRSKEAISALRGAERKQAKAALAVRYGLNPVVYG